MINIQFVTVPGCVHCAEARKIFEELKLKYSEMTIEEIEPTNPEWAELISKYGIFTSPGIIINGELFSTGALNKKEFVKKLEFLAAR